jgi:hypothetical protein
LIKSASYLLHKPQFSGVRKLLLDRSATIVQDDSGIPLAYFGKRWRLRAFGHYAGPISMFAGFYQPQMAGLFQGANPIEFGIGYRWRKNESNLLLAQMQSPPSSEQELSPQSQAERNATETAVRSPKKMRKHVETATWYCNNRLGSSVNSRVKSQPLSAGLVPSLARLVGKKAP